MASLLRCSRPTHPAPISKTEPPKLQRKGKKEKEKANKRNLRKKGKASQGKTKKGKQGPNLQTLKNFKSGSGKGSMQEHRRKRSRPIQDRVARHIYIALSSGSTDPASSGVTIIRCNVLQLLSCYVQS